MGRVTRDVTAKGIDVPAALSAFEEAPQPRMVLSSVAYEVESSNEAARDLLPGTPLDGALLHEMMTAASMVRSATDELRLCASLRPDEAYEFKAFLVGSGGLACRAVLAVRPFVATVDGTGRLLVEVRSHEASSPAVGLLASAARSFQTLVDAAFDASWQWDVESDFVDYSPQVARLLALPERTLFGSIEAWLARVHPDDRQRSADNLHRCLNERIPWKGVYRIRRGDEKYALVEDQGVLLDARGNEPQSMVGVMRDITLERESENLQRESRELYETLFRGAPNAAVRIDNMGRYLDANGAALELLGTSLPELLTTTIQSHFPTEVASTLLDPAAPRGRRPPLQSTVRSSRGTCDLLVSEVPSRVRGGDSLFLLCTDITHLLELQRALEQSDDVLRQRTQLLEDTNTALRVVLDQQDQRRDELAKRISAGIDLAVIPLLTRLRSQVSTESAIQYVDAVEAAILDVANASGLAPTRAPGEVGLTRREQEVASLVRSGNSTAEIARCLYLSETTVSGHRRNIRRKLGLGRGSPQLSTYFATTLQREPSRDGASSNASTRHSA